MRPIPRISLLFSVIVALASCTGGKVYNPQFAQNYQHLELMAEHGGRDMKLDVLGTRGGTDPETLVQLVAEAMSGRNVGLPITFTPTPTDPPEAPSKIVVLFGPAPSTLGRQVCAGDAAFDDSGTGNSMIVAYCRRGMEMSSIWVDLPPDSSVESASFNDTLAFATRQLLPVKSPFDTTETCRNNC